MSERPGDSGGFTSGDPLGGGGQSAPPQHESGLPGYTTTPPPGAGGPPAPATHGEVLGRYVLSGWWRRAGAQVIDGIIVGIGASILFLPLLAAGLSVDTDAGAFAWIDSAILWVVTVAIDALLYAPALMARTNGKTVGRMITGIRVVRTSGEHVTFGWAMLREVAVKTLLFGVAGALTGGLAQLVDYLWPLWDEENRALHDFIVQSRVVKD